MVHSVPTGQVVPTSGQAVDSTFECSGFSTTGFYQLSGSVQLQLLNELECARVGDLSIRRFNTFFANIGGTINDQITQTPEVYSDFLNRNYPIR